MTLMSAAALSRGEPDLVARLPLTEGIPHELVVQSSHQVSYDQAWMLPGARCVIVGSHVEGNEIPDGGFAAEDCSCTEAEFEAAINERTAGVLFAAEYGCSLDLPTVARIAKRHGIPVLVDSASQLPPRTNLLKYLQQGATLCCYKGGGAVSIVSPLSPVSAAWLALTEELLSIPHGRRYAVHSRVGWCSGTRSGLRPSVRMPSPIARWAGR